MLDNEEIKLTFGKHKGELITRVPSSYLRFMINKRTPQEEDAKAEYERRGEMLPDVEISGNAIDKASFRVLSTWQLSRNNNEGFYSWLSRMTLEAIDHGNKVEDTDMYHYMGMKLVIINEDEFPTLKTIMTA